MSENNLPRIGLNVICKNEEKVIGRMLRSVAPLIDYYVIIDTGSTDNTKKVIEETTKELGIPGEIHDHDWVDFCTARNFALEKIQGKAEWGFWIDCDEQLILDERFNKEKLYRSLKTVDVASTKVHYGGQKYFRSQLFRVDYGWEWRGAVHEVMFPPEGKTPNGGMVEGLYTLVTPDGNSWGDRSQEAQKKKYLEHAELLKEYIKKDDDVRWIFYLAQSYRDAFEWEQAEYWYNERLKQRKGYWEELYWSAMMVAAMKMNQQKPAGEILKAYLDCGQYDINRCEHLIPVIKQYQASKNWQLSYLFSKHCYDNHKKSPFPKSTLFISNDCYDWQILDLHCVNAFYMRKYSEAKSAYNKLIKACNKGLVPESEVKRIKENQKWYTKKSIEQMEKQLKDNPNTGVPTINK